MDLCSVLTATYLSDSMQMLKTLQIAKDAEEEVSTGKECRPVSEDLSLQVPAEVKICLVARESTSEFSIGNVSTAIEVSWRLTAGDQVKHQLLIS